MTRTRARNSRMSPEIARRHPSTSDSLSRTAKARAASREATLRASRGCHPSFVRRCSRPVWARLRRGPRHPVEPHVSGAVSVAGPRAKVDRPRLRTMARNSSRNDARRWEASEFQGRPWASRPRLNKVFGPLPNADRTVGSRSRTDMRGSRTVPMLASCSSLIPGASGRSRIPNQTSTFSPSRTGNLTNVLGRVRFPNSVRRIGPILDRDREA
jgi:hypothetical protein